MNEDTATQAEVEQAIIEDTVQEPKKERKIFKGKIVKLKDLGTISGPVAVQSMKPSKVLPGLLIISTGRRGWRAGTTSVQAYAYSGPYQNTSRWLDINDTEELNVLSGTMATKLLEKYKQYRSTTLYQLGNLNFTMGSDPEIFAVKGKATPESIDVVPAWTFLDGKDGKDRTAPGVYGANPMYWDGFQAEFTTRAESCLGWVLDSIQAGLLGLYEKLPKGTSLSMHSVLPVDPDILNTAEEKYVQFGCMPSFNVYGLSGISASGRDCPIRFAGGHIHFGVGGFCPAGEFHKKKEVISEVVYALDAILGVACVSLFESMDNPVRREWYGLPGEYRLPPHGLEYRTLSNAWLCHPTITNIVLEVSRRAFTLGYNGLSDVLKTNKDEVISVILKHDVPGAREILARNKGTLTSLFSYPGHGHQLFNVLSRDVRETIKDPFDLVKNWNLNATWTKHCDGYNKNWRLSVDTIAAGEKL